MHPGAATKESPLIVTGQHSVHHDEPHQTTFRCQLDALAATDTGTYRCVHGT